MLSCKEVSRLVSDSLDRDLPFRQRVGVRLHLMMCRLCRAYEKQVLLLRQFIQLYGKQMDHTGSSAEHLSEGAKQRIKHKLSSGSK